MDASLAEVRHELITLTALLVLYSALALWRLHSKKGMEGKKAT
jgi:ABC-2 type transport system permease protein